MNRNKECSGSDPVRLRQTALSHRAVLGVLLGTAVGDALGLPAEGLSPQRIRRRWPGGWRHRFLFGRGMISDDTEHTLLVARRLTRRTVPGSLRA